jgi:single-strand DNA-binding protein
MPNHANVTIIGHMGKDPVTETKGEYTTCRFSVATSRKRKDKDLTTWWSVTCWRKDAEYAAKYLKKGDPVLVMGEPYMDEWEKDGQKHTMLKIEALRVSSLGSRSAAAPSTPPRAPASKPDPADDDVPF